MTDSEHQAAADRLTRIMDAMVIPGDEDPGGSWRSFIRSGAAFAIQEPGLAHLRALARRYTAETHGSGPSFETVEGWVLDVLIDHEGDPDAAARGFLDKVETLEERGWAYVIPMPHLALPPEIDGLALVNCELRRGLPSDLQVPERDRERVGDRFDTVVAVVRVTAVDQRTAWRAALQRLAVAEAILGAASAGDLRPRPSTALYAEGGAVFGVGRSVAEPVLTPWPAIDSDQATGQVWRPGWAELVDAAGKFDRTDWEERSLSAVRWFDRMRRTWDAGEVIVAGFAALEALVVPENTPRKGRKIAERTTELARLADFNSPTDQRSWMKRLYGQWRTDAVHFGRRVDRDLDAERLTEVVAHLVRRWATRHLAVEHRVDGRPCLTIEETMAEDLHQS